MVFTTTEKKNKRKNSIRYHIKKRRRNFFPACKTTVDIYNHIQNVIHKTHSYQNRVRFFFLSLSFGFAPVYFLTHKNHICIKYFTFIPMTSRNESFLFCLRFSKNCNTFQIQTQNSKVKHHFYHKINRKSKFSIEIFGDLKKPFSFCLANLFTFCIKLAK